MVIQSRDGVIDNCSCCLGCSDVINHYTFSLQSQLHLIVLSKFIEEKDQRQDGISEDAVSSKVIKITGMLTTS